MRPRDGLIPNSPQQDAGIRIDPPPSDPCASGSTRAATCAAAPPLEPPGVRSVFHGLRQAPLSSDSVTAVEPNSGVFVLPTTMNPAPLSRRTSAASAPGTFPANGRDEYVVGTPATSVRSLIAIGTP